jgi:hypothetical protein
MGDSAPVASLITQQLFGGDENGGEDKSSEQLLFHASVVEENGEVAAASKPGSGKPRHICITGKHRQIEDSLISIQRILMPTQPFLPMDQLRGH